MRDRPPLLSRLMASIFDVSLYAYPRAFRVVFGAEMREAFLAGLTRARARGSRTTLVFCFVTFADALQAGVAEHLAGSTFPRLAAAPTRVTRQRARIALATLTLVATTTVATAALTAVQHFVWTVRAFAEPTRLVTLGEVSPALHADLVSPLTFDDWAAENVVFDGLAAYRHWPSTPLDAGDSSPTTVTHVAATANYFNLLGVRPLLGRIFVDEQRPVGSEAVISHAMWQRRFGGARDVVGRRVWLRGTPTTIVGVLPAHATGIADDTQGDIWTCLFRYDVREQRAIGYRDRYLRVIGRLRDGVSVEDARRQMGRLQRRLWDTQGAVASGFDVAVTPLAAVEGAAGAALLVAVGACVAVSLIVLLPPGAAMLQVALATVVLVCTGLLWQSVQHLERADPGFDPRQAISFDVFLSSARYESNSQRLTFADRLFGDLSRRPHVEAVGAVSYFPQRSKVWPSPIWSTTSSRTGPDTPFAYLNLLAGDGLRALGARLEQGRLPTHDETLTQIPVAVVNRTLASRLFGDAHALGRRVQIAAAEPWFEIIGVVADMRQQRPEWVANAEVFLPYWSMPLPFFTVIVKTDAAVEEVTAAVRDAVRRLDPSLPVPAVTPVIDQMRARHADRRAVLAFLALLALVALGTIAVSAQQAMPHVMAVMAGRAAPAIARGRVCVAIACRIGLPGLLLGGLAATLTTPRLNALWIGVSPRDVPTYAITALVLVTSTVIGAVLVRRDGLDAVAPGPSRLS